MGLPQQAEWPDCVSLPWTSFKPVPKQPFEKFIPDIESTAKDLLEVGWCAVFLVLNLNLVSGGTCFQKLEILKLKTRNQGFMSHLIWSVYLSIYLSDFLWDRPQMYVHLRPILCCTFEAELASNVQLSDWLRGITWENKLSLPQMYIYLRLIHSLSQSESCTFEADLENLQISLKI